MTADLVWLFAGVVVAIAVLASIVISELQLREADRLIRRAKKGERP